MYGICQMSLMVASIAHWVGASSIGHVRIVWFSACGTRDWNVDAAEACASGAGGSVPLAIAPRPLAAVPEASHGN